MLYNFRIEFIVNLAEVNTYGDSAINADILDSNGDILSRRAASIDYIEWLRRRLSQPGRTLHIKDIGIGPDLIINDYSNSQILGRKLWDQNQKWLNGNPLV